MSEIKAFYHYNESWYSKTNPRDCVDQIMVGIYSITESGNDDGCVAEMGIRWYSLGGKSVPKLEAFDDAFELLGKMPELVAYLISMHDASMSPATLAGKLIEMGYKDKTSRVNPYEVKRSERDAALAKLTDRDREVLGLEVEP